MQVARNHFAVVYVASRHRTDTFGAGIRGTADGRAAL
jgi:hypothetical protein